MSTINHRHHHLPVPHPGWFFAVAAVLVGILLAMVIANARTTSSVPSDQGGSTVTGQHGGSYQPAEQQCFAGRPGQSIEFARTMCSAP